MSWYKRIQLQVTLDFKLFPGRDTPLGWALNFESRLHWRGKVIYDTRPQFNNGSTTWASVAIRVLGLDVGFGICYAEEIF